MQTVTLPFIKRENFTVDWVYNILEHKKESERIVYEDLDPESGFVLLPDFKWSCKQVEDLYLIAIVHNRKIKSIRDLNCRHLPLLKKIWEDGTKAIKGKKPFFELGIYKILQVLKIFPGITVDSNGFFFSCSNILKALS